jgi:hypothetical protein
LYNNKGLESVINLHVNLEFFPAYFSLFTWGSSNDAQYLTLIQYKLQNQHSKSHRLRLPESYIRTILCTDLKHEGKFRWLFAISQNVSFEIYSADFREIRHTLFRIFGMAN